MRYLLLAGIFAGSVAAAQVPGEWTWMGGDSFPNSSGVFGTQGVPDAANKPPALYQACGAADKDGNFWLFGGTNFTDDGGVRTYNTLWKFDPVTGEWTWMKGLNGAYECGSYGTIGIPSQSNTPGSRYGAVMWSEPTENVLWLFGGYGDAGCNANETFGLLNDLWRYELDSNQWVWIKGPKEADDLGVYGLKGKGDDFVLPRARHQSNSWINSDGNLWLFGGYNQQWGEYYNDLWKYDPVVNQWTWMKGDSFANQEGSYGVLGVPDSANNPSARTCQAHWVDEAGDLWMFGGYNNATNFDLWQYSLSSNNWTCWGSFEIGTISNNGVLCVDSPVNWTTGRKETSFSWFTSDHLWLFGGFGFSLTNGTFSAKGDLWKYNIGSHQWIRVYGIDGYLSSIFGNKGVSSPDNRPMSRFGGVSWQDTAGNFWLFGGIYDYNYDEKTDCFNDLWRFVPDSTCGVFTSANQGGSTQEGILLFPNPASSQLFIESTTSTPKTFRLINQLGELVMEGRFSLEAELNVSAFQPGFYLLIISDLRQKMISTEKILILK